MQEYYEARSEAWQESERGDDFAERLEAVQEVLEAVAELAAADTKKSAKTLDGPPQMSGSVAVDSFSICAFPLALHQLAQLIVPDALDHFLKARPQRYL